MKNFSSINKAPPQKKKNLPPRSLRVKPISISSCTPALSLQGISACLPPRPS